jgi:hypothetical protein
MFFRINGVMAAIPTRVENSKLNNISDNDLSRRAVVVEYGD